MASQQKLLNNSNAKMIVLTIGKLLLFKSNYVAFKAVFREQVDPSKIRKLKTRLKLNDCMRGRQILTQQKSIQRRIDENPVNQLRLSVFQKQLIS